MGPINLSDREKQAIGAINSGELHDLVDEAMRSEHLGKLSSLPLYDCGEYVATKLRYFDRALAAHRIAKSAKKREETLYSAHKAGSDLTFAFGQMEQRLEVEEREGQLFFVCDPTILPFGLTQNMQMRVSYRWRRTTEDAWTSGSIIFKYKVQPRFDYDALAQPKPKRKPSARKLAEDRENDLLREWEHLGLLAHWSVRDYFKAGHDGAGIPGQFEVRLGDGDRLNNFSADFWDARPASEV
ncbi:hypothetical protein OHD62_34285 [Mesorhizobium sp. YC-39]|uniref:hypothetical protein n=1 Tax=unclassified Mesorhizobium TaxID=325217 RepID=UPI0021E72CA8|nr:MULTISPECIES: hypothetical protein [unclassified Mesorhizobium]MCV3211683.1 hypothetical protein [Mesorhizobium sp. YC-2]MCV3233413.1 hypothetical protein [Mesorhizobium sp. YC-39]